MFLHYTIPILIRQNIKFKIFVVSQIDGNLFNRAKLLNIGFNEGKLEVYALNERPFLSTVDSISTWNPRIINGPTYNWMAVKTWTVNERQRMTSTSSVGSFSFNLKFNFSTKRKWIWLFYISWRGSHRWKWSCYLSLRRATNTHVWIYWQIQI